MTSLVVTQEGIGRIDFVETTHVECAGSAAGSLLRMRKLHFFNWIKCIERYAFLRDDRLKSGFAGRS